MSNQARIILADDDPIMRELAATKLIDAGYSVTAVENGADALSHLKTAGADLVISDLDMPVMDGFGLTENIRADKQIDQTPVIVVTSSDSSEAVDRVFAAGATSFLAKPINWTLFSQAVMFVLRASENQSALIAARDSAQAGEKFKDGLMSIMSHELRTPLNAIIGFGQLLAEKFNDQNDHLHKEYADYIVDGGKRLLNSVSDMLLASDARSGLIGISEVDTTLDDVVSHGVAMNEKAAGVSGAEICVRVADPEIEICGDNQLLSRAIGKLIENALKFGPRGVKIVVGAALTKTGDLAILVKDDGPGISPEKLPQICAPYAQSDMSTRRSKEGLGLGLPLVKAIAEAHNAKFKIDSTLGDGVRALLILPAKRITPPKPCAQKLAG